MGTVTSNTKREVRFNIDADEIIDPATTITIQLPAAVDAQGAQAAIRVKQGGDQLPVRINVARNGRSVHIVLGEAAATAFGTTASKSTNCSAPRASALPSRYACHSVCCLPRANR
jgi:hypothetical protein